MKRGVNKKRRGCLPDELQMPNVGMSEKYEAVLAGRRFTIEQDLPEVGWYLQEDENGS